MSAPTIAEINTYHGGVAAYIAALRGEIATKQARIGGPADEQEPWLIAAVGEQSAAERDETLSADIARLEKLISEVESLAAETDPI